MSESLRQNKIELRDRLIVELEMTRRKETYLSSYILDLSCEIRQIEFDQAEANGEPPYQQPEQLRLQPEAQ